MKKLFLRAIKVQYSTFVEKSESAIRHVANIAMTINHALFVMTDKAGLLDWSECDYLGRHNQKKAKNNDN